MIYTITLNPAIDYILHVDSFKEGVNKASRAEISFGGKGINVSVVLSRLGCENCSLGFIAGKSGEMLLQTLEKENLTSQFVKLESGNTRINVKILSSNQYDINTNGPDISQNDIKKLIQSAKNAKPGDYIVMAGSSPKALGDGIYEHIAENLKSSGAQFVFDTTGKNLLNALKFKPFLIKPNHHELGEIFGVSIDAADEKEITKYARMLQEKGARNVLVSRGKHGATLVSENGGVFSESIVKGKVISNVGCGDSMVAGFLAGYIQTQDYAYALKLGSAAGNATAFSETLAHKDEILNILNNNFLN